MRPGVPELALAASAFLATTVALTWPLAAHVATHWPATTGFAMRDQPVQAAVLGHETSALLHDPLSFPHAPFYHPTRWALLYGEAAFGALPLFFLPYALTANAVLALNVVFFAGVVLTATSLYATARWCGAHRAAAAVAGLFFVVNPWTILVWGTDAPSFTLLWAWPLVIALGATARVRRPGRLAAALAAQAITSIYVAASLLASYVAIALGRLARGDRVAATRMLVAGAIGGAAAAAVLGWHVWLQVVDPTLGAQAAAGRDALSARQDLFDTFRAGRPTGLPAACALLIGVGAWLVRARGSDERRLWWHCVAWAGCAVALALPLNVAVFGVRVPTPAWVLATFGSPAMGLRDTRRFGLGFLVAAALASALACELVRTRAAARWGTRRGTLAGLAAAAFAVAGMVWQFAPPGSYLAQPLRPLAFPIYQVAPPNEDRIVEALRRVHGAVLELPLNQITQTIAMRRGLRHGQPVIDGAHSYYPASFPEIMRVACDLPDPAAIRRLRAMTGLAGIVVHLGAIEMNYWSLRPYGCVDRVVEGESGPAREAAVARWNAAADHDPDLQLLYRDAQTLVFRVVPSS